MKMKQKIKKSTKNKINFSIKTFFKKFSLIYSIFYIVFAFLLYNPLIYFFLYKITNSHHTISLELKNYLTYNLIEYLLFLNSLDITYWTQKELIHYFEVRVYYLILFIIFLISLIILFYTNLKKEEIKKISKKVLIYINLPLLIIPFFSYFWNNIFHSVLFNNNYWIIDKNDASYYLFNDLFFICFFLLWYILNLIIFISIYFSIKEEKKH